MLSPDERGFGSDHSLGISYGISDRLSIGIELEGQRRGSRLAIDGLALSALFRLNPTPDGKLDLAIKTSVGSDSHGNYSEAKVRLMAQLIGPDWWLQSNLMMQHEAEGSGTASLAFIVSASHAVAPNAWLGVEVSGDIAQLSGDGKFDGGRFIGPSFSTEFELSENIELEVGVVGSARLAGEGPDKSLRLFAQFEF